MSVTGNQYEKRDAAFEDWIEEGDIPLPKEPKNREFTIMGLQIAFNAGWDARKRIVDYKVN